MSRMAQVSRQTAETSINIQLDLDGAGRFQGTSGIGFFDHMLGLLAAHGRLDLTIEARGDLQVDGHHTVEDCGLVLGDALHQALGQRQGINRYGSVLLPMDEALVLVALDLSGRPYLDYRLEVANGRLGDLDVELVPEFLRAFANRGGITLHVRRLAGANSHHLVEAVFKGLGRGLRQAVAVEPGVTAVPSTKGLLE